MGGWLEKGLLREGKSASSRTKGGWVNFLIMWSNRLLMAHSIALKALLQHANFAFQWDQGPRVHQWVVSGRVFRVLVDANQLNGLTPEYSRYMSTELVQRKSNSSSSRRRRRHYGKNIFKLFLNIRNIPCLD